MGCTGALRAQHSYCESYLSHNLPSGAAGVQRVGEESAVVLFERQITEFRFVGNESDEFEVIHRKYQIFDENALSDLVAVHFARQRKGGAFHQSGGRIAPKGWPR